MATQRILLQKKVKELRRSASGCKECGRGLPQGLMLGGPGLTFSELIREPGMTWNRIQSEIDSRGFMCRGCLNRSTEVSPAGARSSEELMKDPAILKKMKEYGIPVPEEDGGGDNMEVDPMLASPIPLNWELKHKFVVN